MTRILACIYCFLIPIGPTINSFIEIPSIWAPHRIIAVLLSLHLLYAGRLRTSSLNILSATLLILLWGMLLAVLRGLLFGSPVADPILWAGLGLLPALTFFLLSRHPSAAVLAPRLTFWFFMGSLVTALLSLLIFVRSGTYTERFEGGFKNATELALSMLLCITLSLLMLRTEKRLRFKLLAGFGIVIGLYLVDRTGSRASLGGAAIAFGMLLMTMKVSPPIKAAGALIAISLAVYFSGAKLSESTYMDEVVARRMTTDQLEEGAGRKQIWQAALDAGADSYYLGIGVFGFKESYQHYIVKTDAPIAIMHGRKLVIHSHYISLLVEFGFYSLLFFLAMIYRHYKCETEQWRREGSGITLRSRTIGLQMSIYVLPSFLFFAAFHDQFQNDIFWGVLMLSLRYKS